jgi:hypothetical protein
VAYISEHCFAVTGYCMPITVIVRSKAWTVFARSNAGFVGRNPTQGMDVCLSLFCVCVVSCSGFTSGWSPVQGALPTVYRLGNWSEMKRFTDALCSKWKQQEWMNGILYNWLYIKSTHTNFRHYATSRKVVGSIPDEVIGFFNLPNSYSLPMALGSTHHLT